MISTTTPINRLKKIIKPIIAILFWIIIWEIASRVVSRNNELLLLILPSPLTVFKKWFEIGLTAKFLSAVGKTLLRILLGFMTGVIIGFLSGILTHYLKVFNLLLSPILRVIRAVPVVAIIILLYLFFSSDILPIIIVSLMVIPIIWQTVHDGLEKQDKKMLEMASVFKLSEFKIFAFIKLPKITVSLITSAVNALGLGWKSGVAAEVICLPDISLGTMLWSSKGNVNYDEVYAVTLTVVILSILLEMLLKSVCNRCLKGGADDD